MVKQGPIVREVRGLERVVSETINSRGGVLFPSNRCEEGCTESAALRVTVSAVAGGLQQGEAAFELSRDLFRPVGFTEM